MNAVSLWTIGYNRRETWPQMNADLREIKPVQQQRDVHTLNYSLTHFARRFVATDGEDAGRRKAEGRR